MAISAERILKMLEGAEYLIEFRKFVLKQAQNIYSNIDDQQRELNKENPNIEYLRNNAKAIEILAESIMYRAVDEELLDNLKSEKMHFEMNLTRNRRMKIHMQMVREGTIVPKLQKNPRPKKIEGLKNFYDSRRVDRMSTEELQKMMGTWNEENGKTESKSKPKWDVFPDEIQCQLCGNILQYIGQEHDGCIEQDEEGN